MSKNKNLPIQMGLEFEICFPVFPEIITWTYNFVGNDFYIYYFVVQPRWEKNHTVLQFGETVEDVDWGGSKTR